MNKFFLSICASIIGCSALMASSESEKLRIFDWAGYDDGAYFPQYVKKYGGKPAFDFFAEEEEALQKLRSGYNGDLSHPCGYSFNVWRDAGLLQPLDKKKLKNWDQLSPTVKALPGVEVNGAPFVLPYDMGNTAMVVLTDKVDKKYHKSLQSFLDPAFKGKISLPDNFSDTFSLGLLATGTRDWSNLSDAQIKAASDWLRKAHKNVKYYWTDGANLLQGMKSGEIVMSFAWNETPTALNAEKIPAKMIRDTDEGFAVFVCGYVHLKSSKPENNERVYDFLNSVSSVESAQAMVTNFGYGHANKVGMGKLSKSDLQDNNVDKFEEYAKRALFQTPLPLDARKKMIEEFEKIKAGH